MLVIRMQRTGRKGHAQFRVVVQDSRWTPTSGKVIAAIGSYNPHTKAATINKEKVSFYLEHGAQPTDRVVRLLKAEGVKVPAWVKDPTKKQGVLRNADKLRKNRPAEEVVVEEPVAEVAETPTEEVAADAPTEATAPADEEPAAEETKEA